MILVAIVAVAIIVLPFVLVGMLAWYSRLDHRDPDPHESQHWKSQLKHLRDKAERKRGWK